MKKRVDGLSHKICEERVDGLTHTICEERADGLTHKICEERADELTFKIDEDGADGWTDKTCEERADGWTCRNVVEQVLVDGDGSVSVGCNVAQVTPSIELRECANGKCEELMACVASIASMVVASMASHGGVDGGFDGVEWW